MQVKRSVELSACFLSFPLQMRQKLTESDACGHVQVSEFCGLLVGEDLRVDSVQLQDHFVHQLRVQPPLRFEEGAVLRQLLAETVCPRSQRHVQNKRYNRVQQASLAGAYPQDTEGSWDITVGTRVRGQPQCGMSQRHTAPDSYRVD